MHCTMYTHTHWAVAIVMTKACLDFCWRSRVGEVTTFERRDVPRWADYEHNTAQNTYWKNGANQSIKSNPRLRIEAGWYVADRIRVRIEPPHAFDCRKRTIRMTVESVLYVTASVIWKIWPCGTLRIRADFPDSQYVTVSVICKARNLSSERSWVWCFC